MRLLLLFSAAFSVTFVSAHADDLRALFFTKSTGFQHGPVMEKGDLPSVAEKNLRDVLQSIGFSVDETKEGTAITAENLANYDLVIFYTQGTLDRPGLDKSRGIPEGGIDALFEWIENGGGFIGIHSATDTRRPSRVDDPPTPYTKMIGGAFLSHGRQFRGTLRIADPMHPAIAGTPDGFNILDEWYVFSHLDTEGMHVLALLDPESEREKQDLYDRDPYPIVWCKGVGEGRMYYNAMGHREDVWTNPTFHNMLAVAAQWATGHGALGADPNYDEVVSAASNETTDD